MPSYSMMTPIHPVPSRSWRCSGFASAGSSTAPSTARGRGCGGVPSGEAACSVLKSGRKEKALMWSTPKPSLGREDGDANALQLRLARLATNCGRCQALAWRNLC